MTNILKKYKKDFVFKLEETNLIDLKVDYAI
jgi:hypothetical protein